MMGESVALFCSIVKNDAKPVPFGPLTAARDPSYGEIRRGGAGVESGLGWRVHGGGRESWIP